MSVSHTTKDTMTVQKSPLSSRKLRDITKRADVLEYANTVHQEISTWLKELDEGDLDQIPNIPQHLSRYPEYQTPGFIEEASGLFDQPIWSQLMRPCIGHIHRHLGELEVVKNILRTRG